MPFSPKLAFVFIALFFQCRAGAQLPTGLGERLTNTMLIGLGEAGHGYETINGAKAALVTVLRDSLHFGAIAFESSFTLSVVAFLTDTTLDDRARHFLYPFWNTASVQGAVAPFIAAEHRVPLVLGFDVQEDCRFTALSKLLLARGLSPAGRAALRQGDSVLALYIGTKPRWAPLSSVEYAITHDAYSDVATEIREKAVGDSLTQKLLGHCLTNRKWLCRYLSLTTAAERMAFRDSLMAANIAWLKGELYPEEKLILWAADTHVARRTGTKPPRWMGEWLTGVYGEAYYAVSVETQKGWGEAPFLPGMDGKYAAKPGAAFGLTLYPEALKKIRPEQWITPCD